MHPRNLLNTGQQINFVVTGQFVLIILALRRDSLVERRARALGVLEQVALRAEINAGAKPLGRRAAMQGIPCDRLGAPGSQEAAIAGSR